MPGEGSSSRAFTVLRIDELTRMSDTRGVERYYRHRIKTRGGVVMTVDIDAGDFTPEKAEPILRKHAEQADGIMKL